MWQLKFLVTLSSTLFVLLSTGYGNPQGNSTYKDKQDCDGILISYLEFRDAQPSRFFHRTSRAQANGARQLVMLSEAGRVALLNHFTVEAPALIESLIERSKNSPRTRDLLKTDNIRSKIFESVLEEIPNARVQQTSRPGRYRVIMKEFYLEYTWSLENPDLFQLLRLSWNRSVSPLEELS